MHLGVDRLVGQVRGHLVIYEDQDKLRDWLQRHLERRFTPDARYLGRTSSDGSIVGAICYDHWTGLACTTHVAGLYPGWMGSELMYRAYHYPFVVCDCEWILAETTEPLMMDINRRMGFNLDFVRRGVHPDGPIYYMSMQRADCRWLKRGLHGRQSSPTPTSA